MDLNWIWDETEGQWKAPNIFSTEILLLLKYVWVLLHNITWDTSKELFLCTQMLVENKLWMTISQWEQFYLPTQIKPSSVSTKPGGQLHLKLPSKSTQSPFRQMSEIPAHSSTSTVKQKWTISNEWSRPIKSCKKLCYRPYVYDATERKVHPPADASSRVVDTSHWLRLKLHFFLTWHLTLKKQLATWLKEKWLI